MNEYTVLVNNDELSLRINPDVIEINGFTYKYELKELIKNHYSLRLNNKVYEIIKVAESKNKIVILSSGDYFETVIQTKLEKIASQIISKTEKAKHFSDVKSPMPGMVLKIKKRVGDQVSLGDPILILEAMKMENEIKSPFSGLLKEIFVSENSPVEKGALLFRIE